MKFITITTIFILLFGFSVPSFSQENTTSKTKVVSYIGLNLGPAFPLGNLADKNTSNPDAGLAQTGLSISLVNFGMYFGEKFGFNIRWFGNAYPIEGATSDAAWSTGALMFGPTYTLNVFRNAYVDFKPSLGLMSSSLIVNSNTVLEGSDIGLGLGSQFRFNFARKWALTANLDYTTTSPKMKNSSQNSFDRNLTGISSNFGIIYYFKAPNYEKK